MIDVSEFKMRRDIEMLISDIEKSSKGAGHMMIGIHWAAAKEIIERLASAEKDAARYRWLRDTAHTVTGLTPCAFVMMDGELMEDWNGQYGLLCLGWLDAAVDEAMSVNQA